MNIAELKDKINDHSLTENFFIFLHPKNTFLPNQYIDAICAELKLEKLVCTSIFEQESALSLVMPEDMNMRVIYAEEFNEICEDYSRFCNTIIVCEKIDKKIQKLVEDFVIEFPKLADWQIKDYIKSKCPALEQEYIDWLYQATAGDIHRIANELDKLLLFPPEEHSTILVALKNAPGSDLFNLDFYKFMDAIMDNNMDVIRSYLIHQKACNFDIFALTNSLLSKAKNMLLAGYCPNITAEDLEMTPKQFYFYRNAAGKIPSTTQLRKMINILSRIDLKVKSGELDLKNNRQIDYILTQLVN